MAGRERRAAAQPFLGILARLPPALQLAVLASRNSFELVTALVAAYGSPTDRTKILRSAGRVMGWRVEQSNSVPQTWMESYHNLFERTILQSRYHLSLQITGQILSASLSVGDALSQYTARYEAERKEAFEGFRVAALRIFGELAERDVVRTSRPALPANLLRLSLHWCSEEGWKDVVRAYLRAIAVLSDSGASVARVSPLIIAGFRAYVDRFSDDERTAFLRALGGWFKRARAEADEESTKIVINLILRLVHSSQKDSEIYSIARRAAVNLAFERSEGTISDAINAILKMHSVQVTNVDVSQWFMNEWTSAAGLVNVYLELLRTVLSATEENRLVCRKIGSKFLAPEVQEKLALLFISQDLFEEASEAVRRLAEHQPNYPDIDGLRALIAARSGDVPTAYAYLGRTVGIVKDRLHPWLAVRLHQELANHTTGHANALHTMCAMLTRAARLPAPSALGARRRELEGSGDL